ncbi:MAG TPA: Uma2 family endonuclease [Ktedonobacteraceae bacterium]|nr:Uma2 family endonuclease [Ktedonobacteraceae bacterium]
MRGLLGWGKNRAGELGARAFDTREKHNLHQSKQRKDKEVAGKAVATLPWTSQDLEMLPDNGKRYEIIDGELYVSTRPHYYHQRACGLVFKLLDNWSEQTEAGEANLAPGLIFAEDDDVASDVIWTSRERLATALQPDGKLHAPPELVVEVLSPGVTNERRDRQFKLRLYSRRGVLEYWIVSWQERRLEIYRREETLLKLHSTLYETDMLQSPLLPDFRCQVSQFFAKIR